MSSPATRTDAPSLDSAAEHPAARRPSPPGAKRWPIDADSADAVEAGAATGAILDSLGLSPADFRLAVRGRDPVLPVRYPLGIAAAGVFGACGAGLAALSALRGRPIRRAAVDIGLAAQSLVSFRHLRIDGAPIASPGDANPLVGLYRCRDGRWIAIHGGFPSLREPTLAALGCAGSAEAIKRAIAARDSAELEDALAAARQCGVIARSQAEWLDHPQGRALAEVPVIEIERIGDAPPEPLPSAHQVLAGVRVADFTRILAGPICGRFLAAAGADVLTVASPHLPDIAAYALETSHGKRSTWLDLHDAAQAATARSLVEGADVVVDSFRPGALDRHGLGPEALARRARGGVYVSINCYGWSGGWVARPGWELMGQTATGLAAGHGGDDAPAPLWTYPCDYLTGYLGGLGAIEALRRRALAGGSYHVRVSLCRTGMYAAGFGVRYENPPAAVPIDGRQMRVVRTGRGSLQYLPVPLDLPDQPLAWDRFAVTKGADPPAWLPQA